MRPAPEEIMDFKVAGTRKGTEEREHEDATRKKRGGGPSRAELLMAKDRTVPDIVDPGLSVLFCGVNPGLYSAAVGHHFARPGNRFWPALHRSGFTVRLLSPEEERELLWRGCGITNVVRRATAGAAELTRDELVAGGRRLEAKVRRYLPRTVAILGVEAYRKAFGRPWAGLGPQKERIGSASLWVLPNPSGLNAHYQIDDLSRLFAELRGWLESTRESPVDPRR